MQILFITRVKRTSHNVKFLVKKKKKPSNVHDVRYQKKGYKCSNRSVPHASFDRRLVLKMQLFKPFFRKEDLKISQQYHLPHSLT